MWVLSRSLEFSHNCPHNKIEADLYLVSIYTYDIECLSDGTICDRSAGKLDPSIPVSMNMWGFTPQILNKMANSFNEFLRSIKEGDIKTEYPLPSFIGNEIDNNSLSVRVYTTSAEWFGVTYSEDRPAVAQKLAEMKANGSYPIGLKF